MAAGGQAGGRARQSPSPEGCSLEGACETVRVAARLVLGSAVWGNLGCVDVEKNHDAVQIDFNKD